MDLQDKYDLIMTMSSEIAQRGWSAKLDRHPGDWGRSDGAFVPLYNDQYREILDSLSPDLENLRRILLRLFDLVLSHIPNRESYGLGRTFLYRFLLLLNRLGFSEIVSKAVESYLSKEEPAAVDFMTSRRLKNFRLILRSVTLS